MIYLIPALKLALIVGVLILTIAFSFVWLHIFVLGYLKGSPFVRSRKKDIQTMIELADLKPGDKVIDLGSGDGSILIEAAKKGASGVGVEINPFLVRYSRWRIRRKGFAERIKIVEGDIRKYPIQNFDAVFLYLLPAVMDLLVKEVFPKKAGHFRIVSNSFRIQNAIPTQEKNGIFLYHF